MLPAGQVRIYLACGFTDMRKGFHSLAAQVQTTLQHDPYSGGLYVFRGRRGDLVKILFWDRQGMCLYAKRGSRPQPSKSDDKETEQYQVVRRSTLA
jgi:transposase